MEKHSFPVDRDALRMGEHERYRRDEHISAMLVGGNDDHEDSIVEEEHQPQPSASSGELESNIALWEQMAANDYSEVGFDLDADDIDHAHNLQRAERFEPGSASSPGCNLYSSDTTLTEGVPPAPTHFAPAEGVTSSTPNTSTNFTDAEYIKLKEAAKHDYPTPEDGEEVEPQPPQHLPFRAKF